MKQGLLWYDDNPTRDLVVKIACAARRYIQKFGTIPDTCYVHHSAMSDDGKVTQVGGIRVSSRPSILRHHLWIGQEESHEQR